MVNRPLSRGDNLSPFHHVLMYLRPSLLDKDIPHRQTLCNEIINKANLSEA
ncbi:hypothetical protein L208DRAFT_1253504 [Tricholoma matsutake]|nr:hypothetical protein L208DRAFT_1253504 [Tricholoma matsutake 945]